MHDLLKLYIILESEFDTMRSISLSESVSSVFHLITRKLITNNIQVSGMIITDLNHITLYYDCNLIKFKPYYFKVVLKKLK